MTPPGRLGPRLLIAVDMAVGVGVVLVALLRTPDGGLLGWGLALASGVPLMVRRRWAVAAFAVVATTGVVAIVIGAAGEGVLLAVSYALYPLGLRPARHGVPALAAGLAAITVPAVAVALVPGLPVIPPRETDESFATSLVTSLPYAAAIVTGSWLLARVVAARRRYAAHIAALQARQAVVEERLRIARDLHDLVGHTLSLITLKAAVANHLVDSHPGEGRAALHTIERISRQSLDEVRAVLGALRVPGTDALPAETATVPSLADLGRLIEDTRTSGVTVDLALTPEQADLATVPTAVQVSAYRIVQEALTNVLRHAGPTRCRLALSVEPGALSLAVVNHGTRSRRPGPLGQGLLGAQERAVRHGGTLDAGPEPDGGFAVRARLPFTPPVVNHD